MPLHIRGSVSSPTGRSTAGVPISLGRQIGNSGSSSMVGYVQEDGSFDVAVVPGTYTLVVNAQPAGGGEFAVMNLQVTDRDIDGLTLTLSTGGIVHGQIVFDGPGPGAAPLGATISLINEIGGPIIGRPIGGVPVAEDWTFEARGLYGTIRFSGPANLPSPYRLGRIEFDGRDISNTGVEIRSGDHQVVVHLTPLPPR
jgi:hypothetical protein